MQTSNVEESVPTSSSRNSEGFSTGTLWASLEKPLIQPSAVSNGSTFRTVNDTETTGPTTEKTF
jgi:hypothetical protein